MTLDSKTSYFFCKLNLIVQFILEGQNRWDYKLTEGGCCRELLWLAAWLSLQHFRSFSPSCSLLCRPAAHRADTAKQSHQCGVSLGRHLTLCSITCILHNSIIIQLCLGSIRVVTAHIKAPNFIQFKHLEIKLHCSTVQMTLLFLSKKSVFSTFLQDLLSIHGAAQMEETPCLCKEVVPDDHLILILFLVI